MKKLLQYIYYRIAKAYKDIFGIEDAPGYFLIQNCYSWGLIILLASLCFYLLALEVIVLHYFGIKMSPVFAIITVLPFILFHVFSEEVLGDDKKRYKALEKKYKGERLAWLKGIGILLFVILSFVCYMIALFKCK